MLIGAVFAVYAFLAGLRGGDELRPVLKKVALRWLVVIVIVAALWPAFANEDVADMTIENALYYLLGAAIWLVVMLGVTWAGHALGNRGRSQDVGPPERRPR